MDLPATAGGFDYGCESIDHDPSSSTFPNQEVDEMVLHHAYYLECGGRYRGPYSHFYSMQSSSSSMGSVYQGKMYKPRNSEEYSYCESR